MLRIGILAGVLTSALLATHTDRAEQPAQARGLARPAPGAEEGCAHPSRMDRPARFASVRS